MINEELLAELKQILWDEYQIQLPEEDLRAFGENLKGLFSKLVEAVAEKPEVLKPYLETSDPK